MNSNSAKVMSVISLVCGILGIVFSWIPFVVYIALPLAIAGIVLAAIALNAIVKGAEASKGLAIGGLVCSIIAVVVGIPACLCTVVCQSAMADPNFWT